jgi:membrane-associated protease RseP (regulator of RpoE activity)
MPDAVAPARVRGRFPLLNLALFLATVATTLVSGAGFSPAAARVETVPELLQAGMPFAASAVGILFTHEMGHYLMARRYGVDSTLPFFIPAPFGFGTFGAVIRIRSAIPTRRAVLDIGAAGPIAGAVLAIPLLFWGFAHSAVRAVGPGEVVHTSFTSPLSTALALFRGERFGDGAVGSAHQLGDSVITWLAARVTHGELPPGHDIFLHPVALAAWLGLLVTTLNLVPLGQLDGGHVLYALLGRARARKASRVVSWALFAAGLVLSWNWLVWWALTRFLMGLGHPPALTEEPLSQGRRGLAVASLLLFALTFVPVPLS